TKSARALYDRVADKYDENKRLAVGNYTELPAVLALAGDVRGLRVLDAGCGPGRHSRKLLDRGALVTGIDISEEMVRLARERCGGRGQFFRADFARAKFRRASFDLVVASLSLMYAREVSPVIRNFAAWLAPRGRLVFSLYHPVRFFQKIPDFDFSKSRKVWIHLQGCDVTVFNYYHPTASYFDALHENGFSVQRIIEPVLSRRHKGWPEDNYRIPRSIVIEAKRK
ncbi:MAG TPA: methyltransferase domain-containing protein, partial [Pyrinomonadaceae bacterium]|nr:methyltransferase domain-containing protein [Pyrinomonadaceae bacterium]